NINKNQINHNVININSFQNNRLGQFITELSQNNHPAFQHIYLPTYRVYITSHLALTIRTHNYL
ncbi:hypothetical protein, partial [Enterobacter ludwigii]|uniref:hypothetical protein n=1 Tax=Enterobacter ludwigii TaxID=299767 RepID=UPI0019543522